MEHDIVYHHDRLRSAIHAVERDETDREALAQVRESFLQVFDRIKLIMISKQDRYYGLFLMNFELHIDFGIYYDAGVDLDTYPFRMIVNPLLVGLHPLPEMIYIFCHEIEHIVLNHPADGIRYNPKRDPALGFKLNVAMDASINDRLSTDSVPGSVIRQPEDAITSEYLRRTFRLRLKEMQAFDYYFERIPELGEGSKPGRIIFADGDSGGIVTEPKRKGTVCLPCWTLCDDPEQVEELIRSFVEEVCRGMPEDMRGNLPDHQKATLERLLAPPVITWKQLLKRFIGTVPAGQRKTRTRLSRRQPERYDISGTIQSRIIKLIVAIDTSGSMSEEALEQIMVEIFDIIGTRLCEVTIIECDAQIQREYKARSAAQVCCKVQGRGGTSFLPVIQRINSDRSLRDAILIYFTDGMGDLSIPRPLTRRTMWVLHDSQCQLSLRCPYGEVLYMD